MLISRRSPPLRRPCNPPKRSSGSDLTTIKTPKCVHTGLSSSILRVFLDAATYLNRPEIAASFADLPNHATQVTTYTFIQDVDYTYAKEEAGDWQIKHVYLIDYVLGGKQAYLAYAEDVSTVLIPPTQLKAIASYDNYYGGSPHRLVEIEFATQEDAAAYEALEEVIQTAEAQLEIQAGNWSQVLHKFELRSDYIKE